MILPNLIHFGHDGSCYFNNHSRTKHRIMVELKVPENLNCQEEVAATMRIVGQIYDIQSTNNLEIWPSLWAGATWRPYMGSNYWIMSLSYYTSITLLL